MGAINQKWGDSYGSTNWGRLDSSVPIVNGCSDADQLAELSSVKYVGTGNGVGQRFQHASGLGHCAVFSVNFHVGWDITNVSDCCCRHASWEGAKGFSLVPSP